MLNTTEAGAHHADNARHELARVLGANMRSVRPRCPRDRVRGAGPEILGAWRRIQCRRHRRAESRHATTLPSVLAWASVGECPLRKGVDRPRGCGYIR